MQRHVPILQVHEHKHVPHIHEYTHAPVCPCTYTSVSTHTLKHTRTHTHKHVPKLTRTSMHRRDKEALARDISNIFLLDSEHQDFPPY